MLGWIKRLLGAGAVPPASEAKPSVSPPGVPASAALPMAKVEPAKAQAAAPGSPQRSEDGGRVVRRLLRSEGRAAAPAIGMPARVIAPGKAVKVTILAVQSGGRRVLAKRIGGRMVQAFTLRSDRTYRLAGASDASVTQLLLE